VLLRLHVFLIIATYHRLSTNHHWSIFKGDFSPDNQAGWIPLFEQFFRPSCYFK